MSRCTIEDESLLRSLFFNQSTIWSETSKLPDELSPDQVLEDAKYPGMGIKDLHNQGVTGKDVHVAAIDQCMGKSLDHPEYKDSIVEFKSFFPEDIINSNKYSGTSYHGPFVTGLLSGKATGIAPEVEVPAIGDAKYFADALDYITEKNKSLPQEQKIRIVSVSSAPSATAGNTMENGELWEQALVRAKQNDILVLDTKDSIQSCYLDYKYLDNVSKCFFRRINYKKFTR